MLTNSQTKTAGIVSLILLVLLIGWRLWSSEAQSIARKTAPVHTHTITFTCDRTCTDKAQLPETFPWR